MEPTDCQAMPVSESLTAWEIRSLGNRYNLSDGHAREPLSTVELHSIRDIFELVSKEYRSQDQRFEEECFVKAFLAAAKEPLDVLDRASVQMHYSASSAIALIAAALRDDGVDHIKVLHPSFDNIPHLFRRHGLRVYAMNEDDAAKGYLPKIDSIVPGAVFITMPNNPTGWTPSENELLRLSEYCAKYQIPMVLDLTFRFQQMLDFSVYETLFRVPELQFVTIEDTGKTWNLNDMKCSFTVSYPSAFANKVREVADELLLNVSPTVLALLSRILTAAVSGGDRQVSGRGPLTLRRELASRNRAKLNGMLQSLCLPTAQDSESFVAWVPLIDGWSASEVAHLSESAGVSILPGDEFFWAYEDPPQYLRVALLRDEAYFGEAIEILADAIALYQSRKREA